jgi:hypothetical protein
MISIQKYLRQRSAASGSGPEATAGLLLNVCLAFLESINDCILTGEPAAPLRSEVEDLAGKLSDGIDSERAAELQNSFRQVLSAFAAANRETVHTAAEEMHQVVSALSQALSLVAGGGERSVSRLQRIQQMLQQTASIQDVGRLRASLAKTIDAIEEETDRERVSRARDLAALQAEVNKVRSFSSANPSRQLPGRPEGVREISQALDKVKPEEALYVVAFLMDSVKAVIQRFGPKVADDLIFRIIQERIQPVAPENIAFRWTPSSLVGVFQCAPDLSGLKSKMAALNRAPLVHRVELGNRSAVLKVGISHLVAQGAPGTQNQLIAEVDRFTGAVA